MSQYLNIYAVKKDTKEHIHIASLSRSNQIVSLLDSDYHIPWYCKFEDLQKTENIEYQYADITAEMVDSIIDDIKEYKERSLKRLQEYEKHVNGNLEIIDEILSTREYVEELTSQEEQLYFILDIIHGIKYTDIEGFKCNWS